MKNNNNNNKNSLVEFNNRFQQQTKESVNSKVGQLKFPEEQKEKRMKKNEQRLRDLCYTIKHTHIYIMIFPKGEERKGRKNI